MKDPLDNPLLAEVRRLRPNYLSTSATDIARRQMLNHFEKFGASLPPPATIPVSAVIQIPPQVKQITWQVGNWPFAETIVGRYEYRGRLGTDIYGPATLYRGNERLGEFDSFEIAKAHAQADFEKRVRSAMVDITPTHQHKKRGSRYVLLGGGKMQAKGWAASAPGFAFHVPVSVDMREIAIYLDVDDYSLWARPIEEFVDGRFDVLPVEVNAVQPIQIEDAPEQMVYPAELTDDLRDVLSMMLWTSSGLAHALRAGGAEIKARSEEEQAHVLHWLTTLVLKHGKDWRAKAGERLEEIKAEQEKAADAKP